MPRAMQRHLHKTSWECGCLDTQTLLTGNLTGAGCKGRQRFAAIRAQCFNLFQDAGGSMRLFMWHKEQKAVSHCLTAILQMVQT